MFKLFGASDAIINDRKSNWEIFKKEGKNEIQSLVFADNEFSGVNLCNILTIINNRIEKLLDKDHLIGHSYFMGTTNIEDLKFAFQHKISNFDVVNLHRREVVSLFGFCIFL